MADYGIELTALLNIETLHYNETFKRLCPSVDGSRKKDALFGTMWELFVWSAVLGYLNDCPRDIENRYSTPPFRWQNISHDHQQRLQVMAIVSEGSFDILKDPDRLKRNIENHSNGGLYLVHEAMALDPLAYSYTESLLYLIQERISS